MKRLTKCFPSKEVVSMRDDVVRLSFDISVHEHALLKAACAEAMIPMKDFLHDLVVRGIQELKEKKLQEKSTESSLIK
ncbi:MAG: hypothetical protein K2P81_17585 [Bacteriovoracaceae bacterium]|jgi:hypothetical protein|nr:hypothetical protein [Bacteriovoracaceae bacterium]